MKAGIVGYGGYVPRYRIKVEEIARTWGQDAKKIQKGLGLNEKSVPSHDEDTATIAVSASLDAIRRAKIDPQKIGAIYVGSESHPYAVKPTSTIVGDAINAGPEYTAADLEFACKAGSAGVQMCMGLVSGGYIKCGLAVGADTAQGRPGDPLEYSAAAGGAAYLIGRDNVLADIEETYSFSTDTPDFWRREQALYPSHGGRFTGSPAYFKHVMGATNGLLEKTGMKTGDFNHVVFHMPNGKFPVKVAKALDVSMEQLQAGFVVKDIGNTYSGCSMLGLAAVLDVAKAGERILVTSYGSGAGSDSFSIKTTKNLGNARKQASSVKDYIDNKEYIPYVKYAKIRGKFRSR